MSLQMDYQQKNDVRSLDEVTFELETFNNNLKVICCDNENEYLIEFCLNNDNVSLQSIKITSMNENRLISNYRVRQKILSINFNILSDKILFFDENENLIFTFNTNSDIEYLVLISKDTMDDILKIKLSEL